ncbi:MAG: hypothetical protein ACTSVU_05475 [Promethearchaeota archaeon]
MSNSNPSIKSPGSTCTMHESNTPVSQMSATGVEESNNQSKGHSGLGPP